MKAIFFGGPMHGHALTVDRNSERIFIPAPPPPQSLLPNAGPIPQPQQSQTYLRLYQRINQARQAVAIFRAEDIHPMNAELTILCRRLATGDAIVAADSWLTEQMQRRLRQDNTFRAKIAVAGIPFEYVFREIESRRTAARLKRRFPETFKG